jgi:hypothetical protein
MELFYPLIDLLTRKKNLTEQEFLSKYHQNDFDFRNEWHLVKPTFFPSTMTRTATTDGKYSKS